MNKQMVLTLAVILTIPLMISCATAKFKLTQVNQPVMLGYVNKIGSSDTERGLLNEEIDIRIIKHERIEDSYVSGNLAGFELVKRLSALTRTDERSGKIVIQIIYFGSWTDTTPYGGTGTDSWTGVKGAIYENASNPVDRIK